MSKVDAQRAMREAKYARGRERADAGQETGARSGSASPDLPAAPVARTARRTPAPDPASEPVPEQERSQDTCGHRSMNGRSCTRESGHEQKNHRYS